MKGKLLLVAILIVGVVVACVAQDQIESASANAVEKSILSRSTPE